MIVNDVNLNDPLDSSSMDGHSTNDKKPSYIWRKRKSLFKYAVWCGASVVLSTILLYSFYGPLTPNGNRYWHFFNPMTVPLWILWLVGVAMIALLYPYYMLFKSENDDKFKNGIFPSGSSFIATVSSILLSLLNIGSSLLFTISYFLVTIAYIFNPHRVMADDMETLMLMFALIPCAMFWGLVDLIYMLVYRRSW